MTNKNVDEVKGREGRIDRAKHAIKDAVDKIVDRFPGTGHGKK